MPDLNDAVTFMAPLFHKIRAFFRILAPLATAGLFSFGAGWRLLECMMERISEKPMESAETLVVVAVWEAAFNFNQKGGPSAMGLT